MLRAAVLLFLITLIPGLELRASIPAGFFGGQHVAPELPWPIVVLICLVSNILIGMGVFFLLHPIIRACRHFAWCDRLLAATLDRAQRKLRPNVEKYGFLGLAIFIGIPLPMTGAYTGAMGAYALGMSRGQFLAANALGVSIAAVCVTAICLLLRAGVELPIFQFLIRQH